MPLGLRLRPEQELLQLGRTEKLAVGQRVTVVAVDSSSRCLDALRLCLGRLAAPHMGVLDGVRDTEASSATRDSSTSG